MKKQTVLGLCAVFSACLLTSCGRYRNPEDDELPSLMQGIYGGEFTVVSVEERESENRDYVDPRMEKNNPENHAAGGTLDYIYTVQDENGLEFHVVKMLQYGFPGHYRCADDYEVQQILAQQELCAALENSPYDCKYVNTLGESGSPAATFQLTVSDYDNIADAVRLTYDTASACSALLSDTAEAPEVIDWYGIRLTFYLCNGDGVSFSNVTVYREPDADPSEYEAVVEKAITAAQREYVQIMRRNGSAGELPEEILRQNPPSQITNIYADGKSIPMRLYWSDEWQCYYLWDNDKSENGCDIFYDDVEKIALAAGQVVVLSEHAMTITGGAHTVQFLNDGTKKKPEYYCMLDGAPYTVQGDFTTLVLRLTEQDMEALFGITFEFDFVEETATLITENGE